MSRANLSPIKAFLFDLDGTLVDSELYHYRAYQKVINSLGHDLSQEIFIHKWMINGQGMKNFLEKYQIDADPDAMRQKKRDIFVDLVTRELKPFPGVVKLLDWAKENQIPTAVASGSRSDEVKFILETIGLMPYFQVVLGFNDVNNHKPAPDVFIEAAKLLQVEPQNCLVFENTPIGVQAAQAAGMKCVLIPSSFSQALKFPPVDVKLNKLTEFTPQTFAKLTA